MSFSMVFGVHPRACGEQLVSPAPNRCASGSSPRLRGTGAHGRSPWDRSAVHPRACGEQVPLAERHASFSGSSPRLRGTAGRTGNLYGSRRFIPAPAGNSSHCLRSIQTQAVHPRACGEQASATPSTPALAGSSPRLRGTGLHLRPARHVARFIPAPAGNRPSLLHGERSPPVHPRACGEQLRRAKFQDNLPGSSPRLRGTD